MTKLRSLNARGIEEFRGFLQQIRDGAEFRANPAILYIDDYSPRVSRSIEIEPRTFGSKFEAAEYFNAVLSELPSGVDETGLWSWLALGSCCIRRCISTARSSTTSGFAATSSRTAA